MNIIEIIEKDENLKQKTVIVYKTYAIAVFYFLKFTIVYFPQSWKFF